MWGMQIHTIGMRETAHNSEQDKRDRIRPGLASIKLDRNVHSKLETFIEKGNRGDGGIRRFVNETIDMSVNMHTLTEHIFEPFLSLVVAQDNSIFVNDAKAGKVMQVRVSYVAETERVELMCVSDRSKSCIHVAFCLRIPELGKLDIVQHFMPSPRSPPG